VSCFKVFVEGSGDTNKLQAVGREAMKKFLSRLTLKRPCQIIMCGGRQQAYNDFCLALQNPKDGEWPILLVDAEAAMQGETWDHLKIRDGWEKPQDANDAHAFMMVQTMEAWLICDEQAWKAWKSRADTAKLPKIHNANVETIEKDKLEQGCGAVGKSIDFSYLKNKRMSGFGILKHVNPELVRINSKEAKRFFEFIEVEKVSAA
jgi:hypothetical protein